MVIGDFKTINAGEVWNNLADDKYVYCARLDNKTICTLNDMTCNKVMDLLVETRNKVFYVFKED